MSRSGETKPTVSENIRRPLDVGEGGPHSLIRSNLQVRAADQGTVCTKRTWGGGLDRGKEKGGCKRGLT